jgi:phosphoribosylformylglycinamidine synthase
VVKPFVGRSHHGPSDAVVLAPLDALRRSVAQPTAPVGATLAVARSGHDAGDAPGENGPRPNRGVALAVGVNPHFSAIDPYRMAWAVVDEAMRNVVAVGADPDQVSLLDNFSWGNPNLPDRLGGLVRCALGCYDAAVAFGAPFISGKDSLNNEYTGADGKKHAIPGTLVVSALAIVPDIRRTVTMDLKQPGASIYAVGLTRGEMGGSSFERLSRPNNLATHPARRSEPQDIESGPFPGEGWGRAPQPPDDALTLYRRLHQAIAGGLVLSCHDCSEGGLAVAAAEMALAGGLGIDLRLADVPRLAGVQDDTTIAFCESLGRLLVEVASENAAAFEAALAGQPAAIIGQVRHDDRIEITGLAGQSLVSSTVAAATQAWQGHLAP